MTTDSDLQKLVAIATDSSFDFDTPGVAQQGVTGGPVLQPSFAAGGFVTPTGPAPPTAGVNSAPQADSPIPLPQIEAEVQRLTQERPQEVLKIKQAVTQALQSGELTPQELNQALQLATAAAQNPQLYPQIRQFAIQQGLATEEEISPEYDQGLVFIIILAARAAQSDLGGANTVPQTEGQPAQVLNQPQGQQPVASLRGGGEVPDSRNADGSVTATVHEGEFVIPKDVVLRKGTEFFDKLIAPDNGKAKA